MFPPAPRPIPLETQRQLKNKQKDNVQFVDGDTQSGYHKRVAGNKVVAKIGWSGVVLLLAFATLIVAITFYSG